MRQLNERIGLLITRAVGTMECAYLFAALTLVSLPENLDTIAHFVQWLSTSFLQLVLLSIILVGQDLAGRQSAVQQSETHDAVMEQLRLARDHREDTAQKVADLHALHIDNEENTA